MTLADPFDDAQLLLDRARTHMDEFSHLAGLGPGRLWSVRSRISQDSTLHVADLVIDRNVLRSMKAVLSDAANNYIHALDHIPAAVLRARAERNPGNLYFPIAPSDHGYEKAEKRLRLHLGDEWADMFARIRSSHSLFLEGMSLLRKFSGTSKHWQLSAGEASAAALQIHPAASDMPYIVQIPDIHFTSSDSFSFWESADPFPHDTYISVLIGHDIIVDGFHIAAVGTLFAQADTFVTNVLHASRKRLATSISR